MANTYKIKNITVRQKIATGDDTYIVCGNSDYTVHWDLDDEWTEYAEKTMLVVLDSGEAYSIQFTGTEAALPALPNTRRCVIGLMAGDVRTTTGAMFVCRPSIRDASGVPVEPPADVYAQLVSQLSGKISEPSQDGSAGQALVTDGKGGRSWATVQGGSEDAVLYTEQELTDEQQSQARTNIMAGARLFYGSDEVVAEGVALDDGYGYKNAVVFPSTRVPNTEDRTEGNGSYKIIKGSREGGLTLRESADGTGLEASAYVAGLGFTASAEVVSCTKLFPGCWKATIKVIVTGGGKNFSEDYLLDSQLFAGGGASIPFPLLPEKIVYAGMVNTNSAPENSRRLMMTNDRYGYVDSEITIARSDSDLRDAMLNERRVVALNYSDKKADLLFANDTRNPSGGYLITSGIAIKDGKIGTFEIVVDSNLASYLSVNIDIPESDAAPLLVTITEAATDDITYSADHTFADIETAVNAGRNVYAMLFGNRFSLKHINPAGASFGDINGSEFITVLITSDDHIRVMPGHIHELPEPTKDDLGKYLKVVGNDDDGYGWNAEDAPGGGSDPSLGITGALVGQIAKIATVDASGKPTAWQPVDMAGESEPAQPELLLDLTLDSASAIAENVDFSKHSKLVILIGGEKGKAAISMLSGDLFAWGYQFRIAYYSSFLSATNESYPNGGVVYYVTRIAPNIVRVDFCRTDVEDIYVSSLLQMSSSSIATPKTGNGLGVVTDKQDGVDLKFSAEVNNVKIQIFGA